MTPRVWTCQRRSGGEKCGKTIDLRIPGMTAASVIPPELADCLRDLDRRIEGVRLRCCEGTVHHAPDCRLFNLATGETA